ncbi:MAG: Endo-1,4-beta-xylanase Y precursor [Firmicutes bacterium ADurb.BinA205]|nr:MAG: Endo-1,4-beta-xylanase Y precursor [Firmicutes bacterium ADurb.BinA205]
MNILKKMTAGAVLSAVALMGTAALLPKDIIDSTTLTASAETVVHNPIIWADVPDDDVIRVGDTYYMVSTTMFFSPGAPIMKSDDLVSWELCNYVYDTMANGDVQNLTNGKHDYAHGQWAASLRYKDGWFYVFFGSYGTGKSYIYKTRDIENGTWDRVELNGMYHDASILFDDDGRNYLVYGGGGEIKIKEFNSEMTGFKQGGVDKTLFKTGLTGLAGEGSHIQKIGDYYYVFIIAWPNGKGRIELCYRSKSLTGSYEGKTILDSGVGSYGSGLAQGGIVDTPDGKWYGLLFQDHGAVGRIPSLVPVTWVDGWPMMGVNGKAPVTLTMDTDTYKGSSLACSDDFSYSSNDLKLEWQWNHNPDNKSWSVTERDGWLRLHNNTKATNLLNARNTLTMRTEGPACTSYIKLDTKGMKVGDYAGLSAFQFNYGNIGVYVNDSGQKKIYMARNGGSDIATSSNKIIAETNMSGDDVYLKIDFKFNDVKSDMSSSNNIDKASFYYSTNGSDWKQLGEQLGMTYDLKLFTGYRSGIYSYATKNTGGYADIDFFEYSKAEWNPATYTEPDPNGYLMHSTFEGKTDGWSGRGAASVESTGTEHYEGSSSVYVSGRTASWNGVTHALGSKIKSGTEYSFSTNVKYTDGPDEQLFFFTLQYEDTDGEVKYDKIAKGYIRKGEWAQLANTNYMLPAGATNMQIYVETEEGDGDFYIDDTIVAEAGRLIEGAAPAESGDVQYIPGDINSDGCIDSFDVIAGRKGIINGLSGIAAKKAADVDGNGSFQINDLVLIHKFVLGEKKDFDGESQPAGEDIKTSGMTLNEYTSLVNESVVNVEPNDSHSEKSGVQYGTVKSGTYFSTTCNRNKPYNILLPANYDENKKYPVLYVMHGYWENQDRMIIKGNGVMATRQIIGNAIASGEAEDMIVVFPYIYSSATQENCSAMDEPNNQAYDNFINDLTKDLMPHIEKTYSVKTGRENTAITGFSMGGRESLLIGTKRPDLFSYIGAICPAPGASTDFRLGTENDPHLIFLTAGDNDQTVYTVPSGYHNDMEKNNIPHIWHYVKGGYHGDNSIHAHLYNFVRYIFKA